MGRKGGAMFDEIVDAAKGIAGKAGSLGEVKDDVILLKDEAQAIMQEIEELQRIAASLMDRQARVIDAIGRLKDFVDLD